MQGLTVLSSHCAQTKLYILLLKTPERQCRTHSTHIWNRSRFVWILVFQSIQKHHVVAKRELSKVAYDISRNRCLFNQMCFYWILFCVHRIALGQLFNIVSFSVLEQYVLTEDNLETFIKTKWYKTGDWGEAGCQVVGGRGPRAPSFIFICFNLCFSSQSLEL